MWGCQGCICNLNYEDDPINIIILQYNQFTYTLHHKSPVKILLYPKMSLKYKFMSSNIEYILHINQVCYRQYRWMGLKILMTLMNHPLLYEDYLNLNFWFLTSSNKSNYVSIIDLSKLCSNSNIFRINY